MKVHHADKLFKKIMNQQKQKNIILFGQKELMEDFDPREL
jgi:hypothetical protein